MNSRFGLFVVFAPLMITSAQEAGLRNADATYQKLRDAGVAESFVAEGIISFAAPQMGKVTLAVFTGTGEFSLDPVAPIEKGYLKLVSGSETVRETFAQAVFVFTDSTYDEIKRNAKTVVQDPRAMEALRQHRSRVRKRNEIPRSFAEAMLTSEQMDNLEADVLAWLYNPSRPAMFNAYIQGQKRKDLRFYMRGTGAVPELYSPVSIAPAGGGPRGRIRHQQGHADRAADQLRYRNNVGGHQKDGGEGPRGTALSDGGRAADQVRTAAGFEG